MDTEIVQEIEATLERIHTQLNRLDGLQRHGFMNEENADEKRRMAKNLHTECSSTLERLSSMALKSNSIHKEIFLRSHGKDLKDELHRLKIILDDLNPILGRKRAYSDTIERAFQQNEKLRSIANTFEEKLAGELAKELEEAKRNKETVHRREASRRREERREEIDRRIQRRAIARSLSAAFNNRLGSARNWKFWVWPLGGASAFFLGAGITIYFFFIHNMETEEISLAQSLPRLALTSILVSPGVFCLRQYIRHRNILDDYNYKAAVAESIDPTLAVLDNARDQGIYLRAAFEAIHQHPLARNHEPHTSVRRLLNHLQPLDPADTE